jgi:hypothetical protein
MLAGNTLVFNRGDASFLTPANAAGNDSYTVVLLHFDCPPAQVGTVYLPDSAYGGTRNGKWFLASGNPVCRHDVAGKFGQYVLFANSSFGCPHSPELNPTGDFTIDFWYNPQSTSITGTIFSKEQGSVSPYAFVQAGNRVDFYASSNGTSWDVASGLQIATGLAAGTWYHIALTRQGGSWRSFQNGIATQAYAGYAGPLLQSTGQFNLGGGLGSYCNCALDELRISNGIARWIANFAVPNQPYKSKISGGGNDEATKCLMHLNHEFTDVAKGVAGVQVPHVFTNNGCSHAGTPGATALTADVMQTTAQGQRITCPNAIDFDFFAANWTIDFWYYRNAPGAVNVQMISKRAGNGSFSPWLILDSSNVATFLASFGGTAWDVNFTFGVLPGTAWTHVAVVRDPSGMISGYLNGTFGGQQNVGTSRLYFNNDLLAFGGNDTVSPIAFWDELRISDVARWVGNFTPPTQPYA